MIITKESYGDLFEKYEKVKKLIEEDSKFDPEGEPYKSKYAGKKILLTMQTTIEHLLRTTAVPESPVYLKLKGMLGAVFLYLGIVSIDTEESSNGAKYLNECSDTVSEYEIHPEIVLIMLNMLNHFGILKAYEPETSKTYLKKCVQLYNTFKLLNIPPWDISDLFTTSEERNTEVALKNMEKTHTLTLYYLAQIYGTLKDTLKSAIYCHITLKRQLEQGDYDPIDWALNSAVLSQFFMEKNGFTQARHHLAAASYVLDNLESAINVAAANEDEEQHAAKLEQFRHRSADVARCWSKYGIVLLSNSKDRLMTLSEESTEPPTEVSLSEAMEKLDVNDDYMPKPDFTFPSINVSLYEDQITDQFILTYEDARIVFLNVQSWLNKAHEYYTLNNLASDYVQIVQDHSQLYNHLTFFEDDLEKQCRMQKRRIDLLENVLKELNPTYYLQACRQLRFELGECYANILYIKSDMLKESNNRPSAHALSKINTLVEKSLSHFRWFTDSFKDTKTNEVPLTLPSDYEAGYLKAWFRIASLHMRYLTLDKKISLQHGEMCLEAYKLVMDYSTRNERVKEFMKLELGICKEMIELYPAKIMKLTRELAESQT